MSVQRPRSAQNRVIGAGTHTVDAVATRPYSAIYRLDGMDLFTFRNPGGARLAGPGTLRPRFFLSDTQGEHVTVISLGVWGQRAAC